MLNLRNLRRKVLSVPHHRQCLSQWFLAAYNVYPGSFVWFLMLSLNSDGKLLEEFINGLAVGSGEDPIAIWALGGGDC